MIPGDSTARAPRTVGKAWLYLKRSLLCRCPTCGERPIFSPLRETRSLHGWLTPLDGCPRCGYAYEREPGYFLLAIWGVNYGVIGLGAMSVYFLLRAPTDLRPTVLFFLCVMPAPLLSLLFARHAKSMFLAMDHFFDPHLRLKKNGKNSE